MFHVKRIHTQGLIPVAKAADFSLRTARIMFCITLSTVVSAGSLEPSQATMPGKLVSLSDQVVELSLSDAVFFGLRSNRAIGSAYFSRIAEKFNLRVEEDRFNPKLVLSGRYLTGRNQDESYSTSELAPQTTLLGKHGTRFSLSWNYQSDDGGRTGRTRGDGARFSVIQPLLRGAGGNIATASLRRAHLAEQINKLRLKSTVSDTVTQIILAYHEVLRAQEQEKIAREGLKRSRQLLEMNKDMIAAGRMAEFDAVQTEADCVTQELALEETINQLDATRLGLLRLLALDSNTRLTVIDLPVARHTEIGLSKALLVAFEQQPSYLTQLIASEQAAINLEVARNEQLWDISLVGETRQFRTRLPGVSSDNRSWDRYAGVQIDIPFGDLSRKQSEIQASIEVENQGILLADARQVLELEVDNAVRNLGVRWRQYEIAQRARDLSQRKLEVEREKLQAGRSSNFQVLSFETDLRNAESACLNALIAYLNTQSMLDKTLGTTLESWEIELND
jgi:outer membrane protein TolC